MTHAVVDLQMDLGGAIPLLNPLERWEYGADVFADGKVGWNGGFVSTKVNCTPFLPLKPTRR